MAINSICVYCGSSDKVAAKFLDAATLVGRGLAERKMRLVFGGGSTGLMGAVADGALARQGEVVGVIPEHLEREELIHQGLTRLEVVDDMHQRKARMFQLSDAFIALPGGFGTIRLPRARVAMAIM